MPKPYNISPKRSLLVLAFASHSTFAAPPGDVPLLGEGQPHEGHRSIKPDAEHETQFLAARLDALHTALRLKPEQEPAWQKWSSSVKAAPQNWKDKHPKAPTLAKMTVPERLEKMVDFAKERLARLEERLTQTRAFYDVLTPEQQMTFNKDFNFWPHAGHGERPPKPGKALIGPRIGSQ